MPKKTVAVLDFGSEKITVMVGARGINGTFDVKGIGNADYAGFLDGDFLKPNEIKLAMGIAINNAESSSDKKISELFVGVPAEFTCVITNTVSVNYDSRRYIGKKQIEELYRKSDATRMFGTQLAISRSPIYYLLDDNNRVLNPIGMQTSRLGVIVSYVLVDKKFVDKILSYKNDLDLSTIKFVPSVLSEATYLLTEKQRERFAILIDCGYITTSVSLIRGNGLLDMYSFSLGGGNITGDLSQCLKISFSEAEELKRKMVLTLVPKDEDYYHTEVNGTKMPIKMTTANDIVYCRIENIAKIIQKCISSFKYSYPEQTPVYLTGGGLCYIKGGREYLSRMLGKQVDILVPTDPRFGQPENSSILGLLDIALKEKQEETFFKKLRKKFGFVRR